MKKYISAILAALMLLSLAACGLPGQSATPSDVYATDSDLYATDSDIYTTDSDIYTTASDADDESTDTNLTAPQADFSQPFTNAAGEQLVPYVADIYHYGDNVFSNLRIGLCTLGGEIVTEPMFDSIRLVVAAGDIWEEDEGLLYLATRYEDETSYLFTTDADKCIVAVGNTEFLDKIEMYYTEFERDSSGFIFSQTEYELYKDEFCHCVLPETYVFYEKEGISIVNDVNGAEIVTDWPDLFLSCATPGGRVYFVEHDGMCSTYDQDFNLIISVPELGSGYDK